MDTALSWANSGLAILVVLGLCLFFHELGHFLAAKAFRMGVYEFALGFGPALWRRQRGGTLYALRAIPFGGFVRIAGMEPGEPSGPDGFHSRPRWQGLIVVCAGTFMNIVLAVLMYWSVHVFFGIPDPKSRDVVIQDVFPGTVAEASGIKPGDKIVAVNGEKESTVVTSVAPGSVFERIGLRPGSRIFQVGDQPVATPSQVLALLRAGVRPGGKLWVINGEATGFENAVLALEPPPPSAIPALPPTTVGPVKHGKTVGLGLRFGELDQASIHRFISLHPGQPITLTLQRGSDLVTVYVTPQQAVDRVEIVDDTGKLLMPHRPVGRIGVALGPVVKRTDIVTGFILAVQRSWDAVATVVLSIKAMLMKKVAAELSSPIGIMATTAQAAKLGWGSVLSLCGLISANLALLNMFPIPPFDGFHVGLLGVEAVIRRRVDHRLETMVRVAGFVLILNLFIFLALKDIVTLFRFGTY